MTVTYRSFLEQGEKLTGFTATVSAGAASTIDTVAISDNETEASFYVNAAAVKESFTISVQATLNTTEVVNDTINVSTV